MELHNFFRAINFIDDEACFENAKVKVKYFHHNQQAVVNFEIQKFLPIKVLSRLEEDIKKLPHNLLLDFKVAEKEYSFDVLKEYFEYIKIFKLQLFAGIAAHLPASSFQYNNYVITIVVHNRTEVKLIEKQVSSFLHYFYQYGFKKLKIQVNSDPNVAEFSTLKNEVENEIKTVKPVSPRISDGVKSTFYRSNKLKVDLDILENTHDLSDITSDIENVVVTGEIFKITKFLTKTNKWFYILLITDHKTAIGAKIFVTNSKQQTLVESIKEKDTVKIHANSKYDNYAKDQVLWINDLIVTKSLIHEREDKNSKKRVEFHIHTKMSAMDGVTSPADYIKAANKWGHKAIAFTDHLNIQSYPEIAATASKLPNLKVIYGVEMDLIPEIAIAENVSDQKLQDIEYLIFDLETTGLSVNFHEIIEFGYVVVKNNFVIEQNTILIKPQELVPQHITEITNITNEMLLDKPSLAQKINDIKNIIGNRTLVAHNASFDMGFLRTAFKNFNLPAIKNPVIDTLQLARTLNPDLKFYRLGTVCRAYGIKYDGDTAHRADYDANVLAQLFIKMLEIMAQEKSIEKLNEINQLVNEKMAKKIRGQHITVYAKNQEGIKNLYHLVSQSHTKYFYNTPKIIKAEIDKYRDSLIIGSACVNGDIFETAINKSLGELETKMSWFDFIEIQPPDVYKQLVLRKNVTKEQLEKTLINIINYAKKAHKPVIATSDAHYLNQNDKVFRSIIINNKAIGGIVHPLFDYKKEIFDYPEQHLRTTQEMLDEFQFLNDEKLINEIVIDNSMKLADQFEFVKPIKSGLYTPTIVNVDKKLRELCFNQAWELYGNPLPSIIEKRLTKELDAIINHGFAVVYWIAHKLVAKSLADGYLVGSRGSVGSSLVATFANITEVNPLQPHYVCSQCHYHEFVSNGMVKCGYDLPEKLCPQCNIELKADGHDIPFETFLGFDGDKTPDIDLNFSGEYQLRAHDFTKEMFGENNVFRAGTISTVASKTAYGFTKNYLETINSNMRGATLEWLSQGCVGVKRTTGQHPGGIIVVPKEHEITDFTPINYPADDTNSTWKTTHFDFEAIHDNLLKLDILGHVDPTALRMLHDITGIDPKTIPNQDEKVLSLFSNLTALNISPDDLLGEKTGAMGIPEFGTGFVRKMLLATKPKSFAELVQISGLSHGTDVWLNNAETLISKEGLALKDVIGCRDDIMTYLVYQKLEEKVAFNIMEDVRKGKGLKPEYEKLMQKHHVPQWYIESCKKIKYMFPKAHATAYVLMAWRVAWYKVYYPHEYYATYFSTRCDIFDLATMIAGKTAISNKLQEINNKLKNSPSLLTTKEKDLVAPLEVALEMYARGINFTNLDLVLSQTKKFTVGTINNKKVIVPAFVALDGLGEVNAQSIVDAREKNGIFISKENFLERTSVNKTNYKLLQDLGVLAHLPEKEG